jgi:nucleotidyltransferase substrate binding protein (TIGR01987 family)
MERLKERMAQARRAVATFREAVGKPSPSMLERDAAILRFQYNFEAVWKAAQRYLGVVEQLETGSANSAIRSCRDAGLLAEEEAETALRMLRDRNLAVHMYQEKLAAGLYPKLLSYAGALELWLDRIDTRLAREKR